MSVNTKVNGQLVRSAGLYSVSTPIGMADIYSTEEKEVGVWCNGKPLYQKTINLQSIDITVSSSGMYYYAMTTANYISNAELVLGKTEMSYVITNGETRVFEDIEQQGALTVLWSKISRPSVDAVVTLQYTKTNDTPWSGKFVPQGYGYVSSGDIYSFEERQIGVWCNGKPLYQITVDFGELPNNTTKTVNHGISNIENVFDVQATANYAGIVYGGMMPLVTPNKTFRVGVRDTTVEVVATDNWTSYTGYITFKYTKTTDVAGSGEYVPSGDKAVHYSENEEVIGTWLGETLYRKLVTTSGSVPSGATLIYRETRTGYDVIEYTKTS